MIHEPPIDHPRFAATLQRVYGIEAERFVYEPIGMVSCGYRVHGPTRYFAKLYPDNRMGRIFAGRLDAYLPLCAWLRDAGVIERLPCAVPTLDGALKTAFDEYVLVVFEFIEGQLPGWEEPLPDALLEQLGRAVGLLHARGKQYPGMGVPVEDFSAPFAQELERALEDLAKVGSQARPGQLQLRRMVEPHIDTVRRLMRRLQALGAELWETSPEHVLCHTDLHGGNMIVDPDGYLHLLDWEGVIIAPAEHDMVARIGDKRFAQIFLPAYERERGPFVLSRTALSFYQHRRNLEDSVDVLVRILYEEASDEQDRFDLGVLADDCICSWDYMEDLGVHELEVQLKAQGRGLFVA